MSKLKPTAAQSREIHKLMSGLMTTDDTTFTVCVSPGGIVTVSKQPSLRGFNILAQGNSFEEVIEKLRVKRKMSKPKTTKTKLRDAYETFRFVALGTGGDCPDGVAILGISAKDASSYLNQMNRCDRPTETGYIATFSRMRLFTPRSIDRCRGLQALPICTPAFINAMLDEVQNA